MNAILRGCSSLSLRQGFIASLPEAETILSAMHTPGNPSSRPFLPAGLLGEGSPRPTGGPGAALQNAGLVSRPIRAAGEGLPFEKRGLSQNQRSLGPPTSVRQGRSGAWRREQAGLLAGSPLPQVGGESCPGFLQQEPACSTPAPWGGALKRAMSAAAVSAPSGLPHWRGRVVPLLLCASGRSFGGTPRAGR